MSSGIILAHFVRAAAAAAHAKGIDLNGVLKGPIQPGPSDQEWLGVSVDQVVELAQSLWQRTNDEFFGLAPDPIPRGTFRMLTLGVIHTPNLGTALARLAEFISLSIGGQANLRHDTAARVVRFEIDLGQPDSAAPVVVDIALAVAHRLASWMIAQQIRLKSVELPYPAMPYASAYPAVFGVTPQFNAANSAIVFDDMYLSLPIVRTESELRHFIRTSPTEIFMRREYVANVAQQVRCILERNEDTALLSAEKVAAKLSLSPQHLRRLLSEEGTGYRMIQEQILRDRAIESLNCGTETIAALATRLGYSEPSAFRRAFRRWTGYPPGAYLAATRGSATSN